jgi:hypothetical protein
MSRGRAGSRERDRGKSGGLYLSGSPDQYIFRSVWAVFIRSGLQRILVNSSLIHSDRVFRSGVTPNPSKFGAGISGEGWAPARLCMSSTVNPIFGDWGSFLFPSKFMTGGEPLRFRSVALLDGLLLGRLSVPSGFFLGARLDFAPVSCSLSAINRSKASLHSDSNRPVPNIFLLAFGSASRLGRLLLNENV